MNVLVQSLCMALGVIPLVAQSQPLPVGALSPFCGDVKSFQEARESPLSFDASKASGGKVFLLKNQEVFSWIQTDRGHHFVRAKGVPGVSDPDGPLDIIKYRDRQFWRRRGNLVLRYDESLKKWWTALQAGVDFSTFDLGFDGRVVLVGTEKNLIEVYEPGAKEPLATEPYPKVATDPATRELLGFYWDEFVTSAQDEYLIIYAPGCGRLFQYNTHSRSLREASTPWKPFDPATAKAMAREKGIIVLNGFPGKQCVQILPAEGPNAVVAFQIVTMDASQARGADGRPKITQTRHTEKNYVHQFRWNLVENSIEPVEESPTLKLPVWLNSQSQPVPLRPLLEQNGPKEKTAKK
ncbi:MAG: hypothetical protein Q8K67_04855 [Geothrix sp.]|nr:hypothetical protein [Geothrix sp.]